MEINYISDDKSIQIKLTYIVTHNLEISSFGKSWPKHTQCLLFYNGLLKGFGTVIKHEKDKDDPKLAIKLCTKKATECINSKWLRKDLWKIVLDNLK